MWYVIQLQVASHVGPAVIGEFVQLRSSILTWQTRDAPFDDSGQSHEFMQTLDASEPSLHHVSCLDLSDGQHFGELRHERWMAGDAIQTCSAVPVAASVVQELS